jgi:hypothetical protein
LNQWLSQLLSALSITVDDKRNLNEIFLVILSKIKDLKEQLTNHESKIQSQELRIRSLEFNQQMQDTNIEVKGSELQIWSLRISSFQRNSSSELQPIYF